MDMGGILPPRALKKRNRTWNILKAKPHKPQQHQRIGFLTMLRQHDLAQARAHGKRAPLKVFSGALEQLWKRGL